MFEGCFMSKKPKIKCKCTHQNLVEKRLSTEQLNVLRLIYQDLASRNQKNILTYENFLHFFNLTGLWGAKLFYQFDQDHTQCITIEEFFCGISRTIKAPEKQKIHLLYSFFQDKNEPGIRFQQFTKMLYNYSKEQLKQILIDDGFIHEQTDFRKPINYSKQQLNGNKILQLDVKTAKQEKKTLFQETYKQLIQYKDPGTFYSFNQNNLTYQINYSNMNILIKQFATKIYDDNKLDQKTGHLTEGQFSKWIKSHQKLFLSYFSMFHVEAWGYYNGEALYKTDNNIQKEFKGKYFNKGKLIEVQVFLVGDALIVCEKMQIIQIICLEGLNILGRKGMQGYAMEISHKSQCYKKSLFYFFSAKERDQWLQQLKIYGGDSLHNNYDIAEVIGTGKFSVVYKCVQKQTKKQYALKTIDIYKLTPQANKAIKNESQLLKIVNHPTIVKYKQTIETKSHIYIITQYIFGVDLYEYVKKKKFLSQYESAFIIGQIIQGTIYLHELQIVHRDLKPENIMVMIKKQINGQSNARQSNNRQSINQVCSIQQIKIIDFGLAIHLSQLNKLPKSQKISGTPNYIAPQLLFQLNPTNKIDNFSIGCILYFLLSGRMPFIGKNSEQTLFKTMKGDYNFDGQIWDQISGKAKDLIIQLLDHDPQSRIQLEMAINHPWFSAGSRKATMTVPSEECYENFKIDFDDVKLPNKVTAAYSQYQQDKDFMEQEVPERKLSIRYSQ